MNIKVIFVDDKTSFDRLRGFLPLLPKERREKVARYRFEEDKILSLIAGLMIYRETGGRELCFNEHEKPYIKECDDFFFSLSHSDRCVAIAADEKEIGVDVERIREKDHDKLARRFFSLGEQKYIDSSEDKPLAFTEIWTRKEAYLKRKGTGITEDLTAFDTTEEYFDRHIRTTVLDGYVLSVCTTDEWKETVPEISILELKSLL